MVNGVASGRGSDLSHARLCTIAVGHQRANAGVVGVDGVGAGGAVDGLSSCVGANLLDVSGHSGVEVSDLFNLSVIYRILVETDITDCQRFLFRCLLGKWGSQC